MLASLSLLAFSCYADFMPTITIRNLDETVKRKLQVRAALNGRSMEAEAREILIGSAAQPLRATATGFDLDLEVDFGTAIRKLFAPLGGVELEIPPRGKSHRPIPTFE
jgi:plasmid stability protein